MTRLDRQSFLGPNSDKALADLTIGLVGLGGGGSHVAQQLAHMGVGKFVLVDPDIVEDTNLNRLVGGTTDDVSHKRQKVDVAARTIRGVNPDAELTRKSSEWQEVLSPLKGCDIVVGGLDSVRAKDELDAFCRRFLIPYIDMGMDVHTLGTEFLIAGQVVLSSPGCPCLRCLGIVTDAALEKEAERYGGAGSRPQVVWPNGVLASLAVGLVAQLVAPWHKKPVATAYLEYDGNRNTVRTSERLLAIQGGACPHHPGTETGEPRFDVRMLAVQQPSPSDATVTPARQTAMGQALQRLVSWVISILEPK